VLRRFCSVERGSWIAKRNVVTLRPSVSWIKGELLQKVTKERKMFESLREKLAKCTPLCRVDSHADEKRWSTTHSKTLRDGENCPKECAFEMRRGWDAPPL